MQDELDDLQNKVERLTTNIKVVALIVKNITPKKFAQDDPNFPEWDAFRKIIGEKKEE